MKKNYWYCSWIMLISILAFMSCDKVEVPVLFTAETSEIAATTAKSGGTIASDGGETITSRGVCYSTDINPTIDDSKTSDGAGGGSFTSELTGLIPNTTYYVRAYAYNTKGVGYGMTMSFTTLGQAPSATTQSASDITQNSAFLKGTINPNYLSTTATFEYGTTTSYGQSVTASQSPVTGSTGTSVSVTISGLTKGTTYHYRVKAENSLGTSYGDDMSFSTINDPPTLPPHESMVIDFSNFEAGKSAVFEISEKGVENSNWEFAVLVAGYFRVLTASTLIVPIAAFNVAVDQTPVWLEEKTWQWSYSVTVASVTYKARLVGLIRTSDVQWKMYVTKEGTDGFAEFLWFEGTSKIDGTGGTWTLNESAAVQQPLLQIDWTKTGTTMGTIKYTYLKTGNFKNSYIEYGKTTGTFDSYYNIYYYNGSAFADMDVEWSSTAHNGMVKCALWFGDTNWHCWNANYVNIVCP